MKDQYKYPLKLRVISSILLFAFTAQMVPAAEMREAISSGKMRLDHYLEKASIETVEEKWKQAAERGLLVAMGAWESSYALNAEVSLEEKENDRMEAEAEYKAQIEKSYLKWKSENYLAENYDLHQSMIYSLLKDAAKDWHYEQGENGTDYLDAKDATKARDSWLQYSKTLISNYFKSINHEIVSAQNMTYNLSYLSSEEADSIIAQATERYAAYRSREMNEIAVAEGNYILRKMLYDSASERKLSDSEAAAAIAVSLANETSAATEKDINNVLAALDMELSSLGDQNLSDTEKDWITRFEKAMDEALAKWDDTESQFLLKRAEWEKNATEVYLNDEQQWEDARLKLIQKRNEWNDKVIELINEGLERWSEATLSINEEIDSVLNEYIATLKNDRETKEKILQVQIDAYNQSREILSMAAEGVNGWIVIYGNSKYNDKYNYWKTEDNSTYVQTEDNIRSLINSLNSIIQNHQSSYLQSHIESLDTLKTKLQQAIDKKANLEKEKDSTTKTSEIEKVNKEIETLEKQIQDKQTFINGLTYNAYSINLDEILSDHRSNTLTMEEVTAKFAETLSDYVTFTENKAELSQYKFAKDEADAIADLAKWAITSAFYWKNCKDNIKKIYSYTGNVSFIEVNNTDESVGTKVVFDELTMEELKEKAVLEYWKEQESILKQVVNYISNQTANAETYSETQKNLVEAETALSTALAAYKAKVEELNTKKNSIESQQTAVKNAQEVLNSALEELNNAQKNYYDLVASFQSVSAMGMKGQIDNLVFQHNETYNVDKVDEVKGKLEEDLSKFYKIYQEYYNNTLARRIEEIKKSYTDGNATTVKNSELTTLKTSLESLSYLNDVNSYKTFVESSKKKLDLVSPTYSTMFFQALSVYYTTGDNYQSAELKAYIQELSQLIRNSIELEEFVRTNTENYLDGQDIHYDGICDEATLKSLKITWVLEGSKKALETFIECKEKKVIAESKESDSNFDELTEYKQALEFINDILNKNKDTGSITLSMLTSSGSNEIVKALVEGKNVFNNQYLDSLSMVYLQSMIQLCDSNKADNINYIIENYKDFNIKKINEEAEKARENIASLIIQLDQVNTFEELKNYVDTLNNASAGLSETAQVALQKYISEFMRNFAIKEVKANNVDNVESVIKNLNEQYKSANEELSGYYEYYKDISSLETLVKLYNDTIITDEAEKTAIKNLIVHSLINKIASDLNSKSKSSLDAKKVNNEVVIKFIESVRNNDGELEAKETDIKAYLTQDLKLSDELAKEILSKVYAIYYDRYESLTDDQKKIYNAFLTGYLAEDSNSLFDKYNSVLDNVDSYNNVSLDIIKQAEKIKFEKVFESEEIFNKFIEAGLGANIVSDLLTLNIDVYKSISEMEEKPASFAQLYKEIEELLAEKLGLDSSSAFNKDAAQDYLYTFVTQKIDEEQDKFLNDNNLNWDKKLINTQWYQMYLSGEDVLYTYLLLNKYNLELLKTVIDYNNNNGMYSNSAKLSKIAKYIELTEIGNTYNSYFDDLNEWVNALELSQEDKDSVYNYVAYGNDCFSPENYDYKVSGIMYGQDAFEINDYYEALDQVTSFIKNLIDAKSKEIDDLSFNIQYNNLLQMYRYENTSYQDTIIQKIKDKENVKEYVIESLTDNLDLTDIYEAYFTDKNTDEKGIRTYSVTNKNEDLQKLSQEISLVEIPLSEYVNSRLNTINSIHAVFEKIDVNLDSVKERINGVSKGQEEMDKKKTAYETALKTYNETYDSYVQKCNEYNELLKQADAAYKTYNDARVDYRAKSEIHEWAENAYVRTEVKDETEYKTPQERLEIVQVKVKAHEAAISILEKIIKGDNNSEDKDYGIYNEDGTYSIDNEEYTEAISAYKNAASQYYKSIAVKTAVQESVIAQQQKVAELQAKKDSLEAQLITTYKSTDEIELLAPVKELVKVINVNGEYKIVLKSESDADDVTDYYFNKYIKSSKDSYGNIVETKESQKDALDWIKKFTNDQDRLNKVIVAAMYYEMLSKDISVYLQEYTSTDADGNYITNYRWVRQNNGSDMRTAGENFYDLSTELPDLPQEMHTYNFSEKYKQYSYGILSSIYNEVMNDSSLKQDMATYLLYKDNYLNNTSYLKTGVEYLQQKSLEKEIDNVGVSITTNFVLCGVNATIAATTLTLAILASCNIFTLASAGPLYVLAALFTTLSGVHGFIGGGLTSVRDDYLYRELKESNDYLSDQKKNMTKISTEYKTVCNNLEKEKKILNVMLYGKEEEPKADYVMEYEDFKKAYNQISEKNEVVKQLALNEFITKEDYDKIVEETNVNPGAFATALTLVTNYYERKQTQADAAVKSVVEKLTATLNENTVKFDDLVERAANGEDVYADMEKAAKAAWGKGSVRYNSYKNDLMKIHEQIDPTGLYLNYSRGTDEYLGINMAVIQSLYSDVLNADIIAKEKAKRDELQLLLTDVEEQQKQYNITLNRIMKSAESEWAKAFSSLNAAQGQWKTEYEAECKKALDQWQANYNEFLNDKKNWITAQYMAVTQGKWEQTVAGSDLDLQQILARTKDKASLAAKFEKKNTELAEGTDAYVNNLFASTGLNALFTSIEDKVNAIGTGLQQARHGSEISVDSLNLYKEVQSASAKMQEEYEKVAADLSEQQARIQLEQTIDQYMESINAKNESMKEMEKSLAREDGYTVSDTAITRTAITGSTIAGAIKSSQSIHVYQDFTIERPTIGTLVQGTEGSDTIKAILLAMQGVKDWAEKVFGKTNEDGKTITYNVKRSSLKEFDVNAAFDSYEEAAAKMQADDSSAQTKADVASKTELENTEKLSQGQIKELDRLNSTYAQIEDGAINQWIGYAPVFKSDFSIEDGKEANIIGEGRGQMGLFYGDYLWNKYVENSGLNDLSKAFYEQRLWDDTGSCFKAPSVRGIADIVCDIVSQIPGYNWVAYVDDIIFSVTDLTFGYQDPQTIAKQWAKKGLSAAIGAGSQALGNAIGSSLDGVVKVLAETGLAMGTSAANQLGSAFIDNVDLTKLGTDQWFNGENFMNQTFTSKNFYQSLAVSGVSAGVTSAMSEINLGIRKEKVLNEDGKYEYKTTYSKVEGFNSAQIANMQKLNGLVGSAVGSLVSYAFDQEVTFNVLNTGDFGFGNTGLLELSFGKNGFKSQIGQGGLNVSYSNISSAVSGGMAWDMNNRINSTVNTSYDGDKNLANALRMQYGYGNETQLSQLNDILKGDTMIVQGGTGGKAQTVLENDKRMVYMNYGENTSWMELGLILGHEAHRDGVKSADQEAETLSAVRGHTDMALRMGSDSLYAKDMSSLISNNENLRKDIIAYMSGSSEFEKYVNGTYDSSADYWRVEKDEAGNVISVLDDGDYEHYTIVDADGNIKVVDKKGSQKGQISTFSETGQTPETINQLMINCGLDYSDELGRWFAKDERGVYSAPEINNDNSFGNFMSDVMNTILEMEIEKSRANAAMGEAIIDYGNKALKWVQNLFTSDKNKNQDKESEDNTLYTKYEDVLSSKELDEFVVSLKKNPGSHCDEYSVECADLLDVKPDDLLNPLTSMVAPCSKSKGVDTYWETYENQRERVPPVGYSLMMMTDGTNSVSADSPHMAFILRLNNDKVYVTHYTGNEKYSKEYDNYKEMEKHFLYKTFGYMYLGK